MTKRSGECYWGKSRNTWYKGLPSELLLSCGFVNTVMCQWYSCPSVTGLENSCPLVMSQQHSVMWLVSVELLLWMSLSLAAQQYSRWGYAQRTTLTMITHNRSWAVWLLCPLLYQCLRLYSINFRKTSQQQASHRQGLQEVSRGTHSNHIDETLLSRGTGSRTKGGGRWHLRSLLVCSKEMQSR